MPYIVNLSTVQSPIKTTNLGFTQIPTDGFNAFVTLCNKHSRPNSCCGQFFTGITNSTWVSYQFSMQLPRLINPYKLGQITTQQFLRGLRNIFSFINNATLKRPNNVRETEVIRQNSEHFLTLQGKSVFTEEDYINAMLEEAWNSIVQVTPNDAQRFQELVDKDEPIYFISNTNELNVHAVMAMLNKYLPDLELNPQKISQNGQDLIQLIPGREIYLYPSYLAHQFKQTNGQTPGLIEQLISARSLDLGDTTVVSQYPGDLAHAKTLGVDPEKCLVPNAFYTHVSNPHEDLTVDSRNKVKLA